MENIDQRSRPPRHFVRGWERLRLLLRVAGMAVVGLMVDAARAGAGDLDLSFHEKGWSTFTAGGDGARGMAVQPDGKILLTGISIAQGRPFQVAVWRLNPDGSRDTSFNGTGEVVTVIPGPEGSASTGQVVTVLPDGKILVAGGFLPGLGTDALLVRYLADGRLDTTFGPDGQGYVSNEFIGEQSVDSIGAVALQSDGKILAGGIGGTLTRYLANGTPDVDFAAEGVALFPFGNSDVTSIAVQNDGKILYTQDVRYSVRRLLPNGQVDESFGNPPGMVIVPGAGRLSVLEDGKILAGGTFRNSGNSGFSVVRLLADGTRDASFGTVVSDPGRMTIAVGDGTLFANLAAMQVQNDGRILFAGKVYGDASPADIALARFTADGAPDSAFGNEGGVRSDLDGGTTDEGRTAVMVSDQKLVVAGRYSKATSPEAGDLLLARYHVPPERALAVEYPAGTALEPHTPLNVGPVTAGTRVVEIILHNTGFVSLTGLAASLTNESHPGEFAMTAPGVTSLAPGEQTSMVVSLTLSGGPGPRTATLHVTTTSQGLGPLDFPLTGARATPLEVWRVTWFGSPDNSGAGADVNDFDGDGLVNFMEYATGGNPHLASATPGTLVKEGAAVTFIYTRPAAALTEFFYLPETAASLAGPWSGAGLTSAVLTESGGMQTVGVTFTGPEPASRRFFRLRVTRQ